jgi:hypothetical protein
MAAEQSREAAKDKKQRGTGFPVLSLGEAVKAVKAGGKYGVQYSASAFAGYLGHATVNSGPFMAKRSAIHDFGLIKVADGQVILTDLGKRVAIPKSVEDERAAISEAFKKCSVFSTLYQASAKGHTLSIAQLGNTAVHDLGVSPQTKDKFARSLVKSAVDAGLAKIEGDDGVTFLESEPDSTSEQASSAAKNEAAPHVETRSAKAASTTSGSLAHAVALEQTWALDDGDITLFVRRSRPLPPAAFSKIGSVMEKIDELASFLGYKAKESAAQESVDSVRADDKAAG